MASFLESAVEIGREAGALVASYVERRIGFDLICGVIVDPIRNEVFSAELPVRFPFVLGGPRVSGPVAVVSGPWGREQPAVSGAIASGAALIPKEYVFNPL